MAASSQMLLPLDDAPSLPMLPPPTTPEVLHGMADLMLQVATGAPSVTWGEDDEVFL
jgi:hypothetical protein